MSQVSGSAFREALSRFASGVVIVACHAPEGPVGFTASAFSSLSLEPPLILVCVAKAASAYAAVLSAPSFGVSVLAAGQESVATQFARQGIDRFANVSLRAGASVPLIEGAIAHLECDRYAQHEAGDHTILVGRVVDARDASGDPLLHYHRKFGGFAARVPSP